MELQQQNEAGVLDLWNNLPGTPKAVSVAGIVFYLFSVAFSVGYGDVFPWYVSILLFVWPLIIVAWLLVILIAFIIISSARVLFAGKSLKDPSETFVKIVVFVPTVIGTALTVVDVFFNDIFSFSPPEDKK
jgi:hypothetical protein